jgi:hypothetical protein
MHRGFIKTFLLTLAAGTFIFHLSAAGRPSLSGTWHLDLEASRFGNMPPIEAGVLTISMPHSKLLHLALSTKNENSEKTVEDTWRIDDRYHPIDGPTSGEVLAKWEGAILLGKKQTVAGIEEIRFRLGPDNESLTESIAAGSSITTLIWRRQ